MHTWRDEVTEALEDLGGEATLPGIMNQVRKRNKKKITNESSIRQTLEDYCSDKSFRSGVDLFYHRGNERSGVYGLRKTGQKSKDGGRKVEIPEVDDTPQAKDFDEPAQPEGVLIGVSLENEIDGDQLKLTVNRDVERRSVELVTDLFEENEWTVQSVEAQHVGYDLLCTKKNTKLFVEVKGRSGNDRSICITKNEYRTVLNNPDNFYIYIVTLVLTDSPKIYNFSGKEFIKKFVFDPLAYIASPIDIPDESEDPIDELEDDE